MRPTTQDLIADEYSFQAELALYRRRIELYSHTALIDGKVYRDQPDPERVEAAWRSIDRIGQIADRLLAEVAAARKGASPDGAEDNR